MCVPEYPILQVHQGAFKRWPELLLNPEEQVPSSCNPPALGSRPLARVTSTPMTVSTEAWSPDPSRDSANPTLALSTPRRCWGEGDYEALSQDNLGRHAGHYRLHKNMEIYSLRKSPPFYKRGRPGTFKNSPTPITGPKPQGSASDSSTPQRTKTLREPQAADKSVSMASFCINSGSNLTVQMLPGLTADFQIQLAVGSLLAHGSWLWTWPFLFFSFKKNYDKNT